MKTKRALVAPFAALVMSAVLLPGAASAAWGPGTEAQPPANSAAFPAVSLKSVSCASAGNCSAVGSYRDSGGATQGLMLTEKAGVWGQGVELALPANASAGAGAVLSSVSCSSAGSCTAVGSYVDSAGNNQAVMVTETSGVWAQGVQATLPADAGSFPFAGLVSVSCRSAGSCSAVGAYDDSSQNTHGVLLTQTAGQWSAGVEAQLPANAATAASTSLTSVSCSSTSSCSAVGDYVDSAGNTQGLLLTKTAGVWATGVAATAPANAAANPFVVLKSVSCPSTGSCSAVGTYVDGSDNGQGLLLSRTSGAWATGQEVQLADPAAIGVSLSAVSCPSAGNCGTGGTYLDGSNHVHVLLANETSGVWGPAIDAALPANADPTRILSLQSVSCGSPGNCGAVGSYTDTSGDGQAMLFTEAAGVWAPGVEATLPAGANANPVAVPDSVSCPSAGSCTAVGTYLDAANGTEGLLLSAMPMVDFSKLIADSVGVGPGTSLVDQARTAQAEYQQGAVSTSCATLADYVNEVKSQTGKMISRSKATELLADARAIQSTIGCK